MQETSPAEIAETDAEIGGKRCDKMVSNEKNSEPCIELGAEEQL